jgi:group I intron endonuclease|tara:strand:- start:68 stop:745 length:678 start_codon:yes stop_codon:yes gene_type:complete
MYSIYKTVNNITSKFYVGKQHRNYDYYLGSGKLLKKAIAKHGKHNFTKVILEDGLTATKASIREQFWIKETGALTSQGYNMNEGGIGGDNSQHIDYANRKIKYNTSGLRAHWRSLTPEQRKQKHKEQGMARAKAWYVSRVGYKKETVVKNINQWCIERSIDSSIVFRLTDPNDKLFEKQCKGWRFRRPEQPKLTPYVNKRGQNQSTFCKGKTWRLKDGKRVWITV